MFRPHNDMYFLKLAILSLIIQIQGTNYKDKIADLVQQSSCEDCALLLLLPRLDSKDHDLEDPTCVCLAISVVPLYTLFRSLC
jgi:hypothetical protein